jgi:hypothetical protein
MIWLFYFVDNKASIDSATLSLEILKAFIQAPVVYRKDKVV